MNAHSSGPVSSLSANSKSLKNFHLNQKFRFVAIAALVGTPLIIAIVAFSFYQRAIDPEYEPEIASGIDESAAIPVQEPPVINDQSTYSAGGSDTSTPTASGMPQGVSVALNSIEQTGLKNNSYVTAETGAIPAGTAVKIDRASWTAFSENLGSVNATFSLLNENRGGSITFENVNGNWRVTGYSISNS